MVCFTHTICFFSVQWCLIYYYRMQCNNDNLHKFTWLSLCFLFVYFSFRKNKSPSGATIIFTFPFCLSSVNCRSVLFLFLALYCVILFYWRESEWIIVVVVIHSLFNFLLILHQSFILILWIFHSFKWLFFILCLNWIKLID